MFKFGGFGWLLRDNDRRTMTLNLTPREMAVLEARCEKGFEQDEGDEARIEVASSHGRQSPHGTKALC
jgi:hypothetical protein